jgi:uncharacterized membrane protein
LNRAPKARFARWNLVLAHLLSLWDRIRESLWALPLGVAGVCAILALVALNLDLPWASEAAWLYQGEATQAPEFAASLVGAMITLTALAFSITMVVLTLAAQQLGPRLIQIFMRDRSAQASLGLFLGAIVYLLLLLRSLDGNVGGQAPNLAITGGTALVLLSVLTLLFFVHALARSIVSDTVIARVGAHLDSAIRNAFPEQAPDPQAPPAGGAPLQLKSRGYVQRIDYDALVRAARKADARIVLNYRPGAHVLDGEIDAWIVGPANADVKRIASRAIVFGAERTGVQDPEWAARQLVEIALRALSPGINDEFTALAVIDTLSLSLARLMARCDAPRVWRDGEGVARVFGPAPTFALMVDASFDQVREAAAGKHRVLHRLAFNLAKLSSLVSMDRAPNLRRHVWLVEQAARRRIEERLKLDEILEQASIAGEALDGDENAKRRLAST